MRCAAARRRRRGVVLLLVLSVLAVAGILAYSILAAAALDAQSAAHARAAVQAESMAENGVNLAMHYLLHPDDSPVALVLGAAGDWHYPGQSNIAVDEDKFSVVVTNLLPATFQIESTGQSRDADGNPCTRRLRVRVVGIGTWAARGAVQFATDVDLEPDVLVEGNLVTSGKYDGGGSVSGMRLASNYATYSSDPLWGPPPAPPEQTVPAFQGLTLVRAVNERSGYYVYNNARCRADYISSSTLSSPPSPTATNPGRVFVYTGSTPLKLSGGSTNDFDGTLVVTQANLLVERGWRFRPLGGMPGLLVAGSTTLMGLDAALEVEGVYYNGGGFGVSITTNSNPVVIKGTMMGANSSPLLLGMDILGPLKFTFDSSKVAVPDLTNQGIRYDRLQIEDWEQAN